MSFTFDDGGGESGIRRYGRYLVPAVLLLLAVWAIWTFAHLETGVKRQAAAVSTLIPIEEPPPPPPPKTPPPPEPKPVTQDVPQPTPPTPQPPTPTPATPSPAQPTAGQNAVTENAPAQSGSDAFNIGAGLGGGGRGSGTAGGGIGGINLAGYSAYLKGEVARLLRAQSGLVNLRSDFQLWIDASGRVTRVEAVRNGGPDFDLVRQGLVGKSLRIPPAGTPMPVKLSLDVRRD